MYILMRIGCIECSCPSEVVGLFHEEAAAQTHADRLNQEEWSNWMNGGQNYYEVFPVPTYVDAIEGKFANYESYRAWHNANKEEWEAEL